jgi:threonine dehydrogenase-like Zn-dependent dehydrogenase
MKTKAVRLHGKNDLRLDEFDLPPIKDDEILAHVVSDSLCMSTYKAAVRGSEHKRVPENIAEHPTMAGHECSGTILEVGAKWKGKYDAGKKFSIQPAIPGYIEAPGYSYEYCGGNATNIILPPELIENNCLLEYSGPGFFPASLSEPMSCIIAAFHSMYRIRPGTHVHDMGTVPGGCMAILAGVGPMGLGAIDYAIHRDRKPGLIVVTDIDDARLQRAAKFLSPEEAARHGVKLLYVNTRDIKDVTAHLVGLTDGKGFDDVFVFAPVRPVVECGDRILGRDGCLNFFAGPTDVNFSAVVNFYNVHYSATHVLGTTGGNTDDMVEALDLMSAGRINPACMLTHVGGLNAVAETTLNLPNIPGGKKLIYSEIDLPLTAIDDFASLGQSNPLFAELARITEAHNGLWSVEAEEYLLNNARKG